MKSKKIFYSTILVIAILILSFIILFLPKENETHIINSIVLIELKGNTKTLYGSGIIINKNNEQYVLTNAHICLAYSIIDPLDILKKQLHFYFKTPSSNFNEVIDSKTMIHDIDNDICFIPIKELQSQAQYMITSSPIKNFKNQYLLNNAVGEFFYYTFNRNAYLDIHKIKGSLMSQKTFENSLFLSTHTIDGDSGSAIFNSQNELVGIIYGQSYHGLGRKLDKILDLYNKI